MNHIEILPNQIEPAIPAVKGQRFQRRGACDVSAALRSAFLTDRWVLPEQASIAFTVDDDDIMLIGIVDQLAVKRRATALARLLRVERTVIDCLRRRSVQSLEDSYLAHIVAEQLKDEAILGDCGIVLAGNSEQVYRTPDAKGHCIRVAVASGTVILSGCVASSRQCRMAEALIWENPGCEFIDNRLAVGRPQLDSDHELNTAVQLCLQRNSQIDASQLKVQTAAAIVQVEGLLKDPSQRGGMLQSIWAVPGVWDIDDCTQTAV